jgi:hypothetical protein
MTEQRLQELREQARKIIRERRAAEGLPAEEQDGLELAVKAWVEREIRRLALERYFGGFTHKIFCPLPEVEVVRVGRGEHE